MDFALPEWENPVGGDSDPNNGVTTPGRDPHSASSSKINNSNEQEHWKRNSPVRHPTVKRPPMQRPAWQSVLEPPQQQQQQQQQHFPTPQILPLHDPYASVPDGLENMIVTFSDSCSSVPDDITINEMDFLPPDPRAVARVRTTSVASVTSECSLDSQTAESLQEEEMVRLAMEMSLREASMSPRQCQSKPQFQPSRSSGHRSISSRGSINKRVQTGAKTVGAFVWKKGRRVPVGYDELESTTDRDTGSSLSSNHRKPSLSSVPRPPPPPPLLPYQSPPQKRFPPVALKRTQQTPTHSKPSISSDRTRSVDDNRLRRMEEKLLQEAMERSKAEEDRRPKGKVAEEKRFQRSRSDSVEEQELINEAIQNSLKDASPASNQRKQWDTRSQRGVARSTSYGEPPAPPLAAAAPSRSYSLTMSPAKLSPSSSPRKGKRQVWRKGPNHRYYKVPPRGIDMVDTYVPRNPHPYHGGGPREENLDEMEQAMIQEAMTKSLQDK